MLVMIDNYDSFTYNLVHYFRELNIPVKVFRNDEISIEELKKINSLKGICISPGPSNPDKSGISMAVIDSFKDKLPIFGVCLGHQCISQYFGMSIVRAPNIMHGITSLISHQKAGIFNGIPNHFTATRYHSLVARKEEIKSSPLEITALSEDDNQIMGIKHKSLPIFGVQFHPESILSEHGHQLLKNFYTFCQ